MALVLLCNGTSAIAISEDGFSSPHQGRRQENVSLGDRVRRLSSSLCSNGTISTQKNKHRNICCGGGCESCGSMEKGCGHRLGGSEQCCARNIIMNNRICRHFEDTGCILQTRQTADSTYMNHHENKDIGGDSYPTKEPEESAPMIGAQCVWLPSIDWQLKIPSQNTMIERHLVRILVQFSRI